MMSEPDRHAARRARRQWVGALLISLTVVTLAWCYAYNRWTREAWNTPVAYGGDAWGTLAYIKALASGEILPIRPKFPKSLGAPFVANWNDYPNVEEGLSVWIGLLARFCGLFCGANLAVLSAHLLAAGSFLFVCRQLRYHPIFSAAGAILFALSRYAFERSYAHITLTYYWHVPLGLLVVYWCLRERASLGSKQVWISAGVSVLHGIHNPYYSGMFLQFLGGAALFHIVRRSGWRQIVMPLLLGTMLVATFAVMNLDTFYTQQTEGRNLAAVERDYSGTERYALKPIELFLPRTHRLDWLQTWTQRSYFDRALFLGEPSFPYLGFIGIAAFAWLFWLMLKSFARQDGGIIPLHFWGVLWAGAYSLVGGLNALLAVCGFILFRSSNRYSIVILAILLLFLIRQLSALGRNSRRFFVPVLATLLIGIGLWDQVPSAITAPQIAATRNEVKNDAAFVSELEDRLPAGAMVFQLPIMDYPEVRPILGVADYELLRPFLFSHDLRFSYGSHKGRDRERWQIHAQQLGTPGFVDRLERYGFSALLVARDGYPDKAGALLAELRALGKSEILAQSPDLIAVALHPVPRPSLPPEFGRDWFDLEVNSDRNWRWSSGNARLVLHNSSAEKRTVRLTFAVETLQHRTLRITIGGKTLSEMSLTPQAPSAVDINCTLSPGRNEIRFETDIPGAAPPTADQRKLAYNLVDFQISETD